MQDNKKKLTISIIVLLLIVLVAGITYALWNTSDSQNGTNSIVAANCLDYNIETLTEEIDFSNLVPVSDTDGNSTEGHTFTIENTCDNLLNYDINIEGLDSVSSANRLNLQYIKVSIDGVIYGNLASLNTTDSVLDSSVGTAYDTRKIVTKVLHPLDTNEHTIRLWLDENTPQTMVNKQYKGVISISASYYNAGSTTAVDYITALKTNGDTSLLYDETTDNNLRYVGANPDNYVWFNDELWRIIGVMNNVDGGTVSGNAATRVKIIKADELGDIYWDAECDLQGNGTCSEGDYYNNWNEATLKTLLNSAYLNRTVSTEFNYGKLRGQANVGWNKFDLTNIGIRSYDKSLAEAATYYLGGPQEDDSAEYYYETMTANDYYSAERSSNVYSGNPTSWTGVVALMYPSDYGYATAGETTTNRTACMAKELYNWDSNDVSDCKNNDWLLDSSYYQWTITPSASGSDYAVSVGTDGYVSLDDNVDNVYRVRPVLYLKSTVKIAGGSGTTTDPYIIY
ncbi:MAG: hypothetical protein IJ574_01985 [Bacilli bacterium]|nr:hypothetical protein [Bacilli bacterium]